MEKITIESVEDHIEKPSLERIEAFMKVIAQDSRNNANAIKNLTQQSKKLARHVNLECDENDSDSDHYQNSNRSDSAKRKLSSSIDSESCDRNEPKSRKSLIHVASGRQTDRASDSDNFPKTKRSLIQVANSKPNERACFNSKPQLHKGSHKRVTACRPTDRALSYKNPNPSVSESVLLKLGRSDFTHHADNDSPMPSASGSKNPEMTEMSDAGILEQLLEEENDFNDYEEEEEGDITEYRVLGSDPEPSWVPPKSSFSWFKKIADIELKDKELETIVEGFKPPAELEHHFVPPKLPKSVWDAVKSSPADQFKQRVCFKAQSLTCTAIKPLLSVLDSLDPDDSVNINNITTSIQLLCSSNLQLNRFRRSMTSPYIKKDLRKSMLAQPIKHDSLFGQDFEKSTDQAIKEQTATQKLLIDSFSKGYNTKSVSHQKKPFQNYAKNSSYSNQRYAGASQSGPSHSDQSNGDQYSRQKFRGRGRGYQRGNYGSRGKPYGRK